MAHDFNIRAAGIALDTIVDNVRLLKYTAGRKRGRNLELPYKHGELSVPDKFFSGADVILEVILPAGTTTEAREALSDLTKIWAAQDRVTVQQNDPHAGEIRALTELLSEPVPTQNRFVYMFPLRNASGFWEDNASNNAASANPPVVTTGGDRPIDDMILTAAGPGFLEHTDDLGVTSRVTIDAAAGAGTYVVDVGAKTVKKAGADQDEFLTVDQPWWMKFTPDAAQSFTSDVAWSVDWRNKWA